MLDLRLPDIAGEDVARSIREVSPVPIIMLTAKSAEDDRVTGLRIGADDYLVKRSVCASAGRASASPRRATAIPAPRWPVPRGPDRLTAPDGWVVRPSTACVVPASLDVMTSDPIRR